ncbi:MAG TPA: hypothetical protein PKJ22_04705 [Candidatus Cloacimonas sp.]|nr:hypothetical protein [Candidatus Cloacimonas sp.]
MLSNKSLILICMLILASALSAWSVTDTYFGNPYSTFDARNFAMGGAGLFNSKGAFGIADNPANLTLMRKTLGFSVNTYLNRNEDNRSIPLYNSFDNYIDDSVYSSNINTFDNYALSAFFAHRFGERGLGLGFYYKPVSNFDADYEEEVRNNRNTDNDVYPEKIAVNKIDNEGSLNKTAFVTSFAYGLSDYVDLNLGIEYALLNGDINQEKTIRWTDWAIDQIKDHHLPDLTAINDYELSGEQFKIGASALLGTRIGLAATFTPGTTLDKKGTEYYKRDAYLNTAMDSTYINVTEDYKLPSQVRFGFVYTPRNVIRTEFNMDIEYVAYSEINKRYDDVFNFYAGVEHQVVNFLPLRLGFQAVNNWYFTTEEGIDEHNNPVTLYHTSKIITPMLTGGSSIKIMDNLKLDLGIGYTWREYEALDMFTDTYYNDKIYTGSSTYVLWPNSHITLADRGWENPDKVRENNITLNAGLNFTW